LYKVIERLIIDLWRRDAILEREEEEEGDEGASPTIGPWDRAPKAPPTAEAEEWVQRMLRRWARRLSWEESIVVGLIRDGLPVAIVRKGMHAETVTALQLGAVKKLVALLGDLGLPTAAILRKAPSKVIRKVDDLLFECAHRARLGGEV
jgi:hypothetical protein